MKVLIAGDFSPSERGIEMIKEKGYLGNFEDIQKLTSATDFSIVNFETNVSTQDCIPIPKYGPNLTTIPQAVDFIKYMGFNVVTLANNHFYDFGDKAVDNTLKLLDKKRIKHVGGGRDSNEAQEILYLEKDTETLAVINACEHEFSIADRDHGGANPIDPIKMFYTIQTARRKADYVLCIIHGGHERFQLPSIRMQKWYRFFIDLGADIIINHHQHCFSGMEEWHGKPIYYGIGNFFFDKLRVSHSLWNEGVLVELDFSNKGVIHKTIPYKQCDENLTINLLKDRSKFDEKFSKLSQIIINPDLLAQEIETNYLHNENRVLSAFQPYPGILRKFAAHGLVPSLITRTQRLAIQNMIECESHRDRLHHILNKGKYNKGMNKPQKND